MKFRNLVTMSIASLAGLLASPAQATFIVDPDPGGQKFYIDKPDNGATSFCGVVGTNQGCQAGLNDDEVNVATDVGVQTGSGYANIKPDNNNDLLTTLTFTPENPNIFSDFSFRGQPVEDVTSTNPVVIRVLDGQNNPVQIFNFFGFNANADFDRIGVFSWMDRRSRKSRSSSRQASGRSSRSTSPPLSLSPAPWRCSASASSASASHAVAAADRRSSPARPPRRLRTQKSAAVTAADFFLPAAS